MEQDSVLITALANRGYGIAKTALPIDLPLLVCVALLIRWLKSRDLADVQSAGRCTV